MFKIEITYNGKPYASISDALSKAIIDGMKEVIEGKLAPFANELKANNASVEISINKDFKGKVIIDNAPEDLKERISQALS